MQKVEVKSPRELSIMREGGVKLRRVKEKLKDLVRVGVSAFEIEEEAVRLIKEEGAIACFKNVPGYKWATCININEGIVHGIPKKSITFNSGDIVSVDVGLMWRGYNLDTSFSVVLSEDPGLVRFLEAGRVSLKKAISKAVPGARVYDISKQIEDSLEDFGFRPVEELVGHGIGRKLHDFPYIPCTTKHSNRELSPELAAGNTLAIEVMYALGNGELVLDEDGWTIKASDGKITGLFEDTIEVTEGGSKVLT